MPGGPMTRTETKGERKRMTTTKQNNSNSSYLVEEVTPQILSLGTKPFVILPLCYKHVITMSSRKIKGRFHELVFSEVCLKHLNVIRCLR